jgi:hypothetical protein
MNMASNSKSRSEDFFIESQLKVGYLIRSFAQYSQLVHKAPVDKELNHD